MSALLAPMRDGSASQRTRSLFLTLAAILPIAIAIGTALGKLFTQSDSQHYLALAAGQPAMLPFASRQLAPLLVRALAHFTTIPHAFVLLGLVSLTCFAAAVVWLVLHSQAPRLILPAIAGLFFWPHQFNGLILPDLLNAALLAAFLVLLQQRRFIFAALLFFPLALSRESVLLTLLCFTLAAFRRVPVRILATATASTLTGLLVVAYHSRNHLPNYEHIPAPLYLLAKAPWNFLRNFLGIDPWSDVYAAACPAPILRFPLSAHLHIGICAWSPARPIDLLAAALTSFGLLPLLLFALRRARPAPTNLLRFTLIYGLTSFCIAGLLGYSLHRLFDYSWPLFLVALPLLLAAANSNFSSTRAALLFLALHLLTSWLPLPLHGLPLLAAALPLYLAGALLLRRTFAQIPLPESPPQVL